MLARSVTLNFVGTVATLAVGFVASLILARWLGPADRGLLAVLASVSTVALTLVGFGIPMAVLYIASLKEPRTGELLGNSLLYAALLTVLVPAAWLAREPLSDLFTKGQAEHLWPVAAALVPLTFVDWTTHNQLLGRLRFGFFNLLTIASRIAALVVTVVLVAWLQVGVIGGLLALAAASAVMIAGALPPLLREARPRLDRALFRELLRYGSRVQVGSILQFVNYRLDVLVLQFFRPLAGVGTYVVAQIVAELVTTLATSFQTSVMPLVAADETAAGRDATTKAALRHHSALALVAIAGDALFGTLLILYGYGHAYAPAIAPMFVLLPAMWFLGAGKVVAGDLRGRGLPGLSSKLAGISMVVTVVLDLALIPPFGVMGAALASLVAYTVFGVASLIALSRVVAVPLRELVVPTREDIALYPRAIRRLTGRVRQTPRPA